MQNLSAGLKGLSLGQRGRGGSREGPRLGSKQARGGPEGHSAGESISWGHCEWVLTPPGEFGVTPSLGTARRCSLPALCQAPCQELTQKRVRGSPCSGRAHSQRSKQECTVLVAGTGPCVSPTRRGSHEEAASAVRRGGVPLITRLFEHRDSAAQGVLVS